MKEIHDILNKAFDPATNSIRILLAPAYAVEHHIADDTLLETESGGLHTNLGAGGAITITLPQAPTVGVRFNFAVMTAQELRIDPGAGGGIYINGAKQADNLYISADDEGEAIEVVADGNGDWITLGKVGTWTVEVP